MIVFCILAIIFWQRVKKDPELSYRVKGKKTAYLGWGLAWASLWILIRCIYRTIELAEGWSGYLITHEPYFWALDSIPMVLTQGIFLLTWPTWCLLPAATHSDKGHHDNALTPSDTFVDAEAPRSREVSKAQ
ncbi:hypothetical protein OIO90_002446 [Microbotryomycetes sp. JL221]|nr:hypothetical protein OIO90_002446 [Microbotryomycetes sp. JL221]